MQNTRARASGNVVVALEPQKETSGEAVSHPEVAGGNFRVHSFPWFNVLVFRNKRTGYQPLSAFRLLPGHSKRQHVVQGVLRVEPCRGRREGLQNAVDRQVLAWVMGGGLAWLKSEQTMLPTRMNQ